MSAWKSYVVSHVNHAHVGILARPPVSIYSNNIRSNNTKNKQNPSKDESSHCSYMSIAHRWRYLEAWSSVIQCYC
jgi:hypothetical protein